MDIPAFDDRIEDSQPVYLFDEDNNLLASWNVGDLRRAAEQQRRIEEIYAGVNAR